VLPEVKFSEFFIGEEKDPNERQSQSTADEKKKYLSTWNQQFKIQSDMLPPYLSLHLAEKILFIGKSIKVLQQISRYDRKGSTQSIPQSELMQYAESIRVHEQSSKLHIVSFELTIDRIRTSVSKYLWNLIVVDSDLFGHLEAFKHYFLLSRGDLYQSFIEDSRVLMSLMPPQHAGQDIKFLYKQAAKKSTAENDPHFERVKISLVPRRNTTTTDIMEVWAEVMKLDYDVQWPLHLLFTQDTIEKYDKIFKFLFLIKRVQFEVQNAWHPLVHRKKPGTQTKEVTMLLLLRARMSFLIENLQFYLHADVLDVQYELLTKRINDTKDFEVALRAHEDYLKKITSQCFLNKKQIQVLKKLFDMIMQLCALVTTEFAVDKEDRQEEEQPNLSETIQELTREYDRQANLLFQILSGQKVLSPHLAQLLVRLDYNKFFSQSIKEEMSDE
jgi:gamma-tubulin complex component 4